MYLNWKKIEELTEKYPGNAEFGPFLNSFDLKSQLGRRIMRAFPECFLSSPIIIGKVSWSALLKDEQNLRREHPEHSKNELVSNGILDNHSIPALCFFGNEDHKEEQQLPWPILHPRIARGCRFGKTVTYKSKNYVVTQCERGSNKDGLPDEIWLTPAEFIDMTS